MARILVVDDERETRNVHLKIGHIPTELRKLSLVPVGIRLLSSIPSRSPFCLFMSVKGGLPAG